MKNNLNIKLLNAIQKGLNEALSNYDLTIIDESDSVLVKNDTYKHQSTYDDIIDRLSNFLYDDKMFKSLVKKMLIVNRQYTVKDKEELELIIDKSVKIFGNECDLNWIDTSQIIDMSCLFYGMKDFNGHIEKWNVSNVEDMHWMFFNDLSFNQLISNWDVSNVKDMKYMFWKAELFNQDISNWDVSNVENMAGMFGFAKSFNQPLGNWDVSNAEDMHWMFYCATSFNQPIGNWDMSNVENKFNIFANCPIKEECKPIL